MGKQSQRALHDGGRATDSTEGDELYAQRRYDEAAEAYRRDAEGGQTGPGHGKLGNALFFAEDWEGAAEAFARAESLSPEHELASY